MKILPPILETYRFIGPQHHRAAGRNGMVQRTILVDVDVLRRLDFIKREKAFRSYSETLREILAETKTLNKSEKGTLPKLKRFVRENSEALTDS